MKLHLGSIDLREVTEVKAIPDLDENTFQVSLTNRVYFLRASNAEEKEKWIKAFQFIEKVTIEE